MTKRRCHYCGVRLSIAAVTRDHVVPTSLVRLALAEAAELSEFGVRNIVPACRPCNRQKAASQHLREHCDYCAEVWRTFDLLRGA